MIRELTPNQRECAALIITLIEAVLSEEQRSRLNKLCLEDPDCRKLYIAEMSIHGMLLWSSNLSRQRNEIYKKPDEALMEIYEQARLNRIKLDAEIELAKNLKAQAAEERKRRKQLEASSEEERSRVVIIPKAVVYGGLAAALLLMLLLLWPVTQPPGPAGPPSAGPETAEVIPEVVPSAQLIRSEQAVWDRAVAPGGMLQGADAWVLEEGFAEIAMPSGASVVLHGPTTFRLIDENTLALEEGRLAAEVPDRAKYFTVATQAMDVVDLGTRFGVKVDPNGAASTSVFEGEIEVYEPTAKADESPRRVKLIAGQSIAADEAGRLAEHVTAIAPDHGYLYRWQAISQRVEIRGQARFYDLVPASVRQETLQDTDHMIVFAEGTAVLVEPLRAWAELPERQMAKPVTIPKGRRVMSYFIHYAPETVDQAGDVTATLTFPGRVLGVVGNVNGLVKTKGMFGVPTTEYMPGDLRTTYALDPGSPDYFAIGGTQGEQLTIHLAAGAFADQARVLVEVPDPAEDE